MFDLIRVIKRRLKSFAAQNAMKLGNGLIISCMLVYLCVLFFLKQQFCPASTGLSSEFDGREHPIICDFSGKNSDICDVAGDVRVMTHARNSTTAIAATIIAIEYSASLNRSSKANVAEEWRVRPYARKGDATAMGRVSEILLQLTGTNPQDPPPRCTRNHTVPALFFSTAGYTGNLYHDFTDVLVPLFITSRRFNGEVQFLVTDMKPWWIKKYRSILRQLSRYEVIDVVNIDHGDDAGVHCFRRAVIGTVFHKKLGVDPFKIPMRSSMMDFKRLLRRSFSLERETVNYNNITRADRDRGAAPRLLIISRKRSRCFMNEREIKEMAEGVGFNVVVAEADLDTDVGRFARVVNSCDVMLGVHGAGLTNMVFLPDGAVVIQLIPFGRLERLARSSFRGPALDMKVGYLDYSLGEEESSLSQEFPYDDPVLRDPLEIHKQGWSKLRSVYLVKQNVKPNPSRLRSKLLESLQLIMNSTPLLMEKSV